MKKPALSLLLVLVSIVFQAQTEKFPVFSECQNTDIVQLADCFKQTVKERVVANFKVPKGVVEENFYGTVNIVFLVDTQGSFKVLYVNTPYKALKTEAIRVFNTFPQIRAASFNNHSVEMQFVFPLKIPLSENTNEEITTQLPKQVLLSNTKKVQPTLNSSIHKKTLFPEHKSALNIPFTHVDYSMYEYYLNTVENTHTASKPFVYSEVGKYMDLDAQKNRLIKPKKTWFGKKLLNEHMGYVNGKNYWITMNPVVDLQLGRDSEGVNTFNNTRAVQINGGLGKKFNFSTSFYESQGRFANYVNTYAESLKPAGGNPAVIPGRGIAKAFKTDAYDYPVAEAYITYTPNTTFNFQFGHGKNFIGDGYRSLFLSDVTAPYPYFKINTTFWKLKYTNLWMWMQDVRPELTVDGAYRQKFMAIHYLSLNVTKKLNIGLFESVIWDDANNRGFDVNYVNPLIFYTAIEFSSGSRAGNSLLGLSAKYKHKNSAFYGQMLVDEFRVSEISAGNGWWGNKMGFQVGAKFFDAFKVKNLYLQAELNTVRPYTYSHDELNYNYGNTNQPLAHLWGANFREVIGIIRYTKNRWFTYAKMVYGKKGFDFNNGSDNFSYGGDVFADNDNRASDYNNTIGQGNKATIFIGDMQVGYLVNPATNLKLFCGVNYRKFNPVSPTAGFEKSNSTWISIGLKTDVFNWYFDF